MAEEASGTDDAISYGIVHSEVGEFPVIEGIARLLVDELRETLVDLVRKGRHDAALRLALDVPFYDRGGSVINFTSRIVYPRRLRLGMWGAERVKRRVQRILADPQSSFTKTVRRLWSPRWAEWQVMRFAMPTFLPQFALAGLVKPDTRVLDFGCGVGHGTFLLSRESPAHVVCADYSFSSLYLARKYFVPDGDFVCLDGDFPLPFASGYFDTVYSSDTLHCLDSKVLLASEFKRLLAKDGAIVLPHLHNLKSSVRFGRSLSAAGYSALFQELHHRILPEEEVIRDLAHGVLDLERVYSAPSLDNTVNGFCLIATHNPGMLRRYSGLWEHRRSRLRAPIVNPIYEVKPRGSGCEATRRVLTNPGPPLPDTGLLPQTVSLPVPDVRRETLLRLAATQPACYADLVSRLVVVDAPERFA